MYQFSWREAPSVYKTEEFVATLLIRPLFGKQAAVSGQPAKQENVLDVQVFVLLTTNMKKSPKHELGPGSALKTQQTLYVKSSTPKVKAN